MAPKWITAALVAASLCVTAPIAHAAQLVSVNVTESASTPAVKPSWPIPNEPNQLFYLQRSSNSNTVVYTSLFDSAGNLVRKRPAQAYWRRYNTDGARKGLKKIEQRFAYGLNIKRSSAGEYKVTLKPAPKLVMTLKQTGSGKAELWATLGGKNVRAVYGYVSIDESGMLPKVTELKVFGIDPATGRTVAETFRVKGGSISQ